MKVKINAAAVCIVQTAVFICKDEGDYKPAMTIEMTKFVNYDLNTKYHIKTAFICMRIIGRH